MQSLYEAIVFIYSFIAIVIAIGSIPLGIIYMQLNELNKNNQALVILFEIGLFHHLILRKYFIKSIYKVMT